MIRFLYEHVLMLKSRNKKYWPYIYKLYKLLINIVYPAECFFHRKTGIEGERGISEKDAGGNLADSYKGAAESRDKIIISLTSYPGRISLVWMTAASLLNQTKKPYKVILWLAKEEFPKEELPASLRRLKKRGLEIEFCEDLKPHKKYFYTMQKYPDCFVVTADDDIFYPENFLEKLWKGYEKYPDTIICHWSHKIGMDEHGNFLPYNSWEDNREDEPSFLNLAVGCNGVLYPPEALGEEAFQIEKIKGLALFTDDLWLKCMSVQSGKKVINCNPEVLIYFNNIRAGKAGLWKKNASGEGRNDIVWKALMEAYPSVKEKLVTGHV